MFERWRSTVRTLMYSREAISSLFSPLRHQLENVQLAVAERGQLGSWRSARLGPRNAWNSVEEACQAGSSGSRMWFSTVERQEPRARKQRSEDAPLFERHHRVVAGVSTSVVTRHAAERSSRDVDAGRGPDRAAPPSPATPIRAGARRTRPCCSWLPSGQEEHAEESVGTPDRASAQPSRMSGEQSFVSPRAAHCVAAQPSARVAAVEDEPVDAFGMANGVGDGHRGALGDAEQREPVEPGGVDHGLEVRHPARRARAPRRPDPKGHSRARRSE